MYSEIYSTQAPGTSVLLCHVNKTPCYQNSSPYVHVYVWSVLHTYICMYVGANRFLWELSFTCVELPTACICVCVHTLNGVF